MPLNQEDFYRIQEDAEQPLEQLDNLNSPVQHDRAFGAKILALSNFEGRHQKIVDSSFEKARKQGESLPGKNGERRNYAYLSRLEKLVDKYGNSVEKRLWRASAKNEDLLLKYEDIPESYWDAKRQDLRDNGYGDIKLTEELKREDYKESLKLQKESLNEWANYLGDAYSPYPLWFKVYAWDGMTKMGKYNENKGRYEVRNKTTVAPFPDPDAEILSGIFEVVNKYHGNRETEFFTEEGERNIDLEKLVQSGNFNKIYSAIQSEVAPIIVPPEKAEDVHGEWVEYMPGEERRIAAAARGTRWCIASSAVARHYLIHGVYGEDEEDDYNDYDDYDELKFKDDEDEPLKSRFYLFHLKDPNTGKFSRNGVASIRLNPNGKVAEISGLEDGQALHDSLVGIVEEKVKSLPGGEEFLPKFADKNKLIRLDRKMKNGEDLTKDELEFIYEINRPIAVLDTYNDYDPRVEELRNKYGTKYALDAGVDVDRLVSKLEPGDIAENLDILTSHGADIDIDDLVSKLDSYTIVCNLNTFVSHDANIGSLVSKLEPNEIAKNLDILTSRGADIDVDNLVSKLIPDDVVENLGVLLNHGANIDMDNLTSEYAKMVNYIISCRLNGDYDYATLDEYEHDLHVDGYEEAAKAMSKAISRDLDILRLDVLSDNLDILLKYGANMERVLQKMEAEPERIIEKLDVFTSHGANINGLVPRLGPNEISDNLKVLLDHNLDVKNALHKMDSAGVTKNLDTILEHIKDSGKKSDDVVELIKKLGPSDIVKSLDVFATYDMVDSLVEELDLSDVAKNFDALRSHGADVNKMAWRFDIDYILRNLGPLIERGMDVDMDDLLSNLSAYKIANNLEKLIKYGADVDMDDLLSNLPAYEIANNLEKLIKYGADVDKIVAKLKPFQVAEKLKTLISYGADKNALLSKLGPFYVSKNLGTLVKSTMNTAKGRVNKDNKKHRHVV